MRAKWSQLTQGIEGGHWIAIALFLSGGIIAIAVGFDDSQLTPYQLKFGKLFATFLGGAAVLVGALRYIWERQEELAWEKTRFMVELFKEFEADPNLRRAQLLVDFAWSSGDDSRLRTALVPMDKLANEQAVNDRKALDRYLDFFDHLYTYLFITKTLTPEDVSSFSGYAIDILDSEPLGDWAFDWGYEDVLRLGIHFREHARVSGRETATNDLMEQVKKIRQVPDTIAETHEETPNAIG